MQTSISPDTDRRFVEAVLARALVAPDAVHRVERERAERSERGEPIDSIARMLCEHELLDRGVAVTVLRDVRAGRGSLPPRAPSDSGRTARAHLGSYALEGELGRGGMGAVFRARHLVTGAVRALKVISGAPDLEIMERFRREADALARVGGAGVVPIHEIGVDRGRVFIVLGLMAGGSLGARLKERGRLPWREAAGVAVTLARALERCHAAGLVHRDLKPDNVLFDDEGRACLADFGCVRDLAASRLTQTGTILGTPAYMPPEQLSGTGAGPKADAYALGVMLHELVTGTRPFEGLSLVDLLVEKRKGRRAPARSVVEDVPRELDDVIERALLPDPGARIDVARLAADLEALFAVRKEPVVGDRWKVLGVVVALSLLLAAAAGWWALVRLPAKRRAAAVAESDAARDRARAALAAHPTGPIALDAARALVAQARERLRTSREAGAIVDAKQDATLDALVVELAVAEAAEALAASSPERALEVLAHAPGAPASLPRAGLMVRARALLGLGRLDASVRGLEELLALGPSSEGSELLGDVLVASGKLALAVSAYGDALADAGPRGLLVREKRARTAALAGVGDLGQADLDILLLPAARATLSPDRKTNATLAPLAPALYAHAFAATSPSEKAAALDAADKLADPPESMRREAAGALLVVARVEAHALEDLTAQGTAPSDGVAICALFRHLERAVALEPALAIGDLWSNLVNLALWTSTGDRIKRLEFLGPLLVQHPDEPVFLCAAAGLQGNVTEEARLASAALLHRAVAHLPRLDRSQAEAVVGGVRSLLEKVLELFPRTVRGDETTEADVEALTTAAQSLDAFEDWLELASVVSNAHDLNREREYVARAARVEGESRSANTGAALEEARVRLLVDEGRKAEAVELAEKAFADHHDEARGLTLVRALTKLEGWVRVCELFSDVSHVENGDLLLEVGNAALRAGQPARARQVIARLLERQYHHAAEELRERLEKSGE